MGFAERGTLAENNRRVDKSLNKFFTALQQGDAQAAANSLRTSNITGSGVYPMLQQLMNVYLNSGTTTPDINAALSNWVGQGYQSVARTRHDKNWSMKQNLSRHIGAKALEFASRLPQQVGPVGPEGVRQLKLYDIPAGTSPEDFTSQYLTNQLLGNLDPTTRAETMSYLARANPLLFRAYENVQAPTATPATATPNQQRQNILAAANQLNWNQLTGGLRPEARAQAATSGPSSLAWLKDYLQTAARGVGTGVSRAQKEWATRHLTTLEQEAAQDQARLGQLQTVAQNLVNPIMTRRSLSQTIGGKRALTNPYGDFTRGGAYRNPTAT